MRIISLLAAAAIAPVLLLVASLGHVDIAYASFHCIRIHAVMGGLNGNNAIQYVELRMDAPGQEFVALQPLEFFDAAGVLKATFTFPANVTNASTGDSILVATSEFNAAVLGGTADFTFSNANTTASNGGDPLHPVQSPGGKVVWLPGGPICGALRPPPADSVAYGGATADFGTAAVALPSPSNSNALRLGNLNITPTDNSTEYALRGVSGSTYTVAPANLATDLATPRNNGRVVLKLAMSVGGVAVVPALPVRPAAVTAAGGRRSYDVEIGVAAAGIALTAAACGAWYLRRRRDAGV